MRRMPRLTLKKILESILKGLLAAGDAHWAAKGAATFIVELSSRVKDLPTEEQAIVKGAPPDQLEQAFSQIDLATRNAAFAAAGVHSVQQFLDLFQNKVLTKLDRLDVTTQTTLDTVDRIDQKVDQVLAKVERHHRIQIHQRDQQIATLRAALERVQNEAAAGDKEAQAAIAEARKSGDANKLKTTLIRIADQQEQEIKERAADFVELCREIAAVAFLTGDLDEARRRLDTVLRLVPDDRDATIGLGNLHFTRGELDAAEHHYRRVLALSPDSLEWTTISYGNLGLIYQTRGHLDEAELMQRKALRINERLGRLDGMAANYNNLGVIYQTRGDLDQAELMQRKSLEINEKLGRLESMASNYTNLGVIYEIWRDLDQAEAMHRKSLEINEKLGRLEGMANNYGNLGTMYQTRDDLKQAEAMHRKALEIEENLGHLEGMASEYGNLGLVYRARGDLDQAEVLLRKALQINEKLGRLEGMARQYGNLGLICRTRDDSSGAREHWNQARELFQRAQMSHMVAEVQAWIDELP